MPSSFPEALLDRYLKVHALAEYGATDGERATAGRLRARMEEENPGVGIDALRLKAERERAANPPPPPPPPPPRPPQTPPPTANPVPGFKPGPGLQDAADAFKRWAPVMGDAVKFAQTVSDTLSGTAAGKQYADSAITIEPAKLRDGVVRIVLRGLEPDLVLAKARLTDTQKQAFARSVGDRVASHLYALLTR